MPIDDLPDLAALIAPLLERVEPTRRPLLIAIAERMAAARYRAWAEAAHADDRDALRACAAREEEIASRVETLFPDAGDVQAEIARDHPELAELNASIFSSRPIEDQLAIQASGERLGAATWRSLAKDAVEARARDTYLACALLEEASAEVLETILARGRRGT